MDTVVIMNESEQQLLELLKSHPQTAEGLTCKEISEIMHWSEKKTLQRLNTWIAMEQVECVMAYRQYITKVWNLKPVYRIIK